MTDGMGLMNLESRYNEVSGCAGWTRRINDRSLVAEFALLMVLRGISSTGAQVSVFPGLERALRFAHRLKSKIALGSNQFQA